MLKIPSRYGWGVKLLYSCRFTFLSATKCSVLEPLGKATAVSQNRGEQMNLRAEFAAQVFRCLHLGFRELCCAQLGGGCGVYGVRTVEKAQVRFNAVELRLCGGERSWIMVSWWRTEVRVEPVAWVGA